MPPPQADGTAHQLPSDLPPDLVYPHTQEGQPRPPVSVEGTNGKVFLSSPPVFIQGVGTASRPVFPEFVTDRDWNPSADPNPWNQAGGTMFDPTIQRLVNSFRTGEEPLSSGHDYRQALEIAIALKLSALQGHRRVELPLTDRSLRAYPHLYRLNGGDRAGWSSIGYGGEPTSSAGDRFGFGTDPAAPKVAATPSRL